MRWSSIRRSVRVGMAAALAAAGCATLAGVAVSAASGTASAAVTHHVYRTAGQGVNVRSGPSPSASRQGWLPDGAPFTVTCWASGPAVLGDPVWLQGSGTAVNGWATDYYIDTHWNTTADLTSQGIPQCGSAPAGGGPSASPPQAVVASAPTVIDGVRLGIGNGFHRWGSCTVEDFHNSDHGWVILVVAGPNRYALVRNGMLFGWFDQGGAPGRLGCPVSDEFSSQVPGVAVQSALQQFTGGWLYWTTGMNHAQPISSASVGAIGWAWGCVARAATGSPCTSSPANGRVPNYYGYCLAFVYDAYVNGAGVRPHGGPVGATALAYQWYKDNHTATHGPPSDMTPAPGDFAVWGPTRPGGAGHIALSIGQGRVITTWDGMNSRIHVAQVSSIGPGHYLGWVSPGV